MDNHFDRIAFRSRLNGSPISKRKRRGAKCGWRNTFSGSCSVIAFKIPARQRSHKVSLHFLQRLLSLLSLFALLTDTLQTTTQTYGLSNIHYAQTPLENLRFATSIPPSGQNPIVHDGNIGTIYPQAIPA